MVNINYSLGLAMKNNLYLVILFCKLIRDKYVKGYEDSLIF